MSEIHGFFEFSNKFSPNERESILKRMHQASILKEDSSLVTRTCENIILGISCGKKKTDFQSNLPVTLVWDGIFYSISILQQLLFKSRIQVSSEDIESILIHAYLEYGIGFSDYLKGKFVIALYDSRIEKVFLIRDKLGFQQLFYYQDSEKLIFSTRLKSILATRLTSKDICIEGLNQYLCLTYIPAPRTIFEGIRKVLAGHYIEFDNNGNYQQKQYWNIKYNEDDLIHEYNLCKTTLRKTLFETVETSLKSHTSCGTFLSGGIDSTIISGISAKISKEPIHAFTIGYKRDNLDESKLAAYSAEKHGLIHHIHYLEFEEIVSELDNLINNLDEPFADASYLPSFSIMKFAGQYVDCMLSGDGGDELFAGYSKYLIGYYSDRFNRLPHWSKKLFRSTVNVLPDTSSLTRKLRKVVNNAESDVFEQRKALMCLGFKEWNLSALLKQKYQSYKPLQFIKNYYDSLDQTSDELSRALYVDLKVVLEGDMLSKMKIASRLAGVQVQSPLLFDDIVELAWKIPSQYKIDKRKTKIILKESFDDLIPTKLLYAPKRGFGVPVGNWLKKELKEDLIITLTKGNLLEQGIFNPDYIRNILDEHMTNKVNRTSELWSLYVLGKCLN